MFMLKLICAAILSLSMQAWGEDLDMPANYVGMFAQVNTIPRGLSTNASTKAEVRSTAVDINLDNHATNLEIYEQMEELLPGDQLSYKIDSLTVSTAKDPKEKYNVQLKVYVKRKAVLGGWDDLWASDSVNIGAPISLKLKYDSALGRLVVDTSNAAIKYNGYDVYRAIENMYVNFNAGDKVLYGFTVTRNRDFWFDAGVGEKNLKISATKTTTVKTKLVRESDLRLYLAQKDLANYTSNSFAAYRLEMQLAISQLALTTTNLVNSARLDARNAIAQLGSNTTNFVTSVRGDLQGSISAVDSKVDEAITEGKKLLNEKQEALDRQQNAINSLQGQTYTISTNVSRINDVTQEQLTLINNLRNEAQKLETQIRNNKGETSTIIINTQKGIQSLRDQLERLERAAVTQPGLERVIRELKTYIAQIEMAANGLSDEQQQQQQQQQQGKAAGQNKIPLK
jgi:hypothetical protein